MTTELPGRLAALRSAIGPLAPVTLECGPRFVLFFSISDGKSRASVFTVSGATTDEAWDGGARRIAESGVSARWLRVDWVDAAERRTWKELRSELAKIKRNYFRLGISLDGGFEHAFLETEINANAMLYGGPKEFAATLNERNFSLYARKRHGVAEVSFADDDPIWLFTTQGAFIGDDMRVHRLDGAGLDAGRRTIERLGSDDVFNLIQAGSSYLASQVMEDGRFHYGWHACFDRPIDTYNSLRHASSLYSMIEAWEVTRDCVLKQAIDRGLAYLTKTLVQPASLPGGGDGAFLIDERSEIKLGGNAVAILALVKYTEVSGDAQYLPVLEKLAIGIVHMQDPDSGSFSHVLNYPALDLKAAFRTIYYDGEAAFGLMRLYGLTRDPRWLAAVEKAFGHFIAQEHWKHHDHWLSYCVNELTIYRPEERYFRFGLDNVKDHLGFVLQRVTTFPTLLELMMAAERMIERLRTDPDMLHLLSGIDLSRFYKALHHRAHYLLNGHFWPELAMYFANPAKITGSFFIRHHAFRVRIDDVEHYLSGFVAYRKYLLGREAVVDIREDERPLSDHARHWSAYEVELATGGQWLSPPAPGWSASGLCIFAPTMREGDIVAVRLAEGERGIPPGHLDRLPHAPAAIIISDPTYSMATEDVPVLVVQHTGAAILALGAYARERMAGKLIGITGSAGKTTAVAMLSHALAPFGPVGQTRHNANLPHGIAWNLASIPWDTPHTVLELAIGRMAQNARLTQPDIAIFTNVLPAHLEYHRDLATVAVRKSRIFEGMARGSTVILNRDMAEWGRVQMAARSRGLTVINYGKSPDCDVQLRNYDPEIREVTARLGTRELRYSVGAAGEHMALNSLAVLAAASVLGLELEPAIAPLVDFAPVAGRGEEAALTLGGLSLTIIDEAYNANPGSMEAALALIGTKKSAGRRIAVLGEMLELGDAAAAYHTRLAPLIEMHNIDRVHVMGDLYDGFWESVSEARRGERPASLDALKKMLRRELRDGDVLLLKGSHSTRMYEVVDWLKAAACVTGTGETKQTVAWA